MQSTKQVMDWHIEEVLTCEVLRLDPDNAMVKKFCNMQNHQGATIRRIRDHYNKNGTWPVRTPESLC